MVSQRFAAIPTTYAGVNFRSRLEARWAAFFDLIGWKWEYEPVDLNGWIPDFWLNIPCYMCGRCHDQLYVEVKPYRKFEDFKGHPAYELECIAGGWMALFGASPETAWWWMVSCSGNSAGTYNLESFLPKNWLSLWREAGNVVQWRKHAA